MWTRPTSTVHTCCSGGSWPVVASVASNGATAAASTRRPSSPSAASAPPAASASTPLTTSNIARKRSRTGPLLRKSTATVAWRGSSAPSSEAAAIAISIRCST